jgi:hypothetical protein
MTPKQYSSFEDIDRELKILKLQRAIEKEHFVFSYHKAKHLFYPKNIVLEIGSLLQQKVIDLILNRFYTK